MNFAISNMAAVGAAAVVSFAFGAVWYMTLAKPWMAAVGKTAEEANAERSPRPFIIATLSQLVMAFFLSGLTASLGMTGAIGTITVALTVWAGFVMTSMVINHTFQGAPLTLTVIDGGHWLGVLVIQAVVLSLVDGWMA